MLVKLQAALDQLGAPAVTTQAISLREESRPRISKVKTAALQQLNAFVNEVNAFINSGRLGLAQGQALIEVVKTILATLSIGL